MKIILRTVSADTEASTSCPNTSGTISVSTPQIRIIIKFDLIMCISFSQTQTFV